jgi:hypothetical protein
MYGEKVTQFIVFNRTVNLVSIDLPFIIELRVVSTEEPKNLYDYYPLPYAVHSEMNRWLTCWD